jgi:hypothetical protein
MPTPLRDIRAAWLSLLFRYYEVVTTTGEFLTKPMSNNSSSIPSVFRFTLKLKPGARKSPREVKTPPTRPQSKLKPGARWSDN